MTDYQKMYDKIVELILCSEKINELKNALSNADEDEINSLFYIIK